MKIRKILIIIVSAIILMLFGLVASTSYNTGVKYGVTNAETIRTEQARKAETYKKTVKSVLVTKVKNTKIRNQIRSTGRVVSVNNITISSQVQGRLVGNNTFKKGTEIKKGEIIFSVENTDLTLLIKAKKSRFMSLISATMADIKLDFNSEFSKWDVFFNAINIHSNLPEFPKMSTTKEKNYIISRSILAEYLSLKSDEEKLSKYTVLAPFDGMVTRSYSDVGANVNPGNPVVDFIRKDEMEIELTVNPSEIKFINIGDAVSFTENGKTFQGRIIRKARFVNTNTQNISVFTSIDDEKNSLYNGMYLNANITTKGIENTFKLPRRAIFEENKVFIVDASKKLRIKTVNIISYTDDEVIIDNLDDNTLIVSEPLVNTTEGIIVKEIIK